MSLREKSGSSRDVICRDETRRDAEEGETRGRERERERERGGHVEKPKTKPADATTMGRPVRPTDRPSERASRQYQQTEA
jgi:hypothetical protein